MAIVTMLLTMRNVSGMEEIVVETMYIHFTVKFVHVLIQEQEILEQQQLQQAQLTQQLQVANIGNYALE